MALPPWTVELLRRGVQDLARQATDPEVAANLKDQATKLVDELPRVAREKVDSLLKQAETSAQPLKDAWSRSDWSTVFGSASSHSARLPIRLINGSGTLMASMGSGVAFSTAVQAAAIPFMSGDASSTVGVDAALRQQLATSFARRESDSEQVSVFVTNSFDGALAMVGSLCQPGGSLFVPRRCAVAMPEVAGDGLLVDRLRPFARGPIREFGGIDADGSVDCNEIVADLQPRFNGTTRRTAIVHLAGTPITANSLPETCSRVVVIPAGTFFAGGGPIDPTPSVEEELAKGADIVVLAGGVLTGTPRVGIVVGKSAVVARMTQHDRAAWSTAPSSQIAMVAAAAAEQSAGQSNGQSNGQSPAKRLASVSEDNLRDRAERLATQLTAVPSIRSVRVTDLPARVSVADDVTLPSRQVMITTDRSPEALAGELACGPIGLLTTPLENELSIDLRWITPEQQARIGELFR